MAKRERTFEANERMSEHEALMWNIEKDPWLNSSGASITILDQPADFEHLQGLMRAAVAKMPRLYERVVPGIGRLSTPAWAPDSEFDFDYHVREVELGGDGSDRDVLDLAAQIYSEPLDRTRPLWRFVSVRGLQGGRGAIYAMIHHVISDGIGQLRMAEMYQSINRNDRPPPPVDLDQIIADALETHRSKEAGGDAGSDLVTAARHTAGHLARRQLGIARRVAGEVVLWPADPTRAAEKITQVSETLESTVAQLAKPADDESLGSPLWTDRSRHRHLEHAGVSVASLKEAAHSVGASLNDAFMAGLAEAGHRYHHERSQPVQSFNSSFVLSTRTDTHAGGNSFTPVPVRLAAGPMAVADRMRLIHKATEEARERAQRTGGIGGLSGVANLLPTSVVTRTARAQASRIDFATSNLRGAPFELFCAGAKVLHTIPMGPVAGTGANITALSSNGTLDIGMFIDPSAIDDPSAFRTHVEEAFADMFTEMAPKSSAAPVKKKTPAKKTTAKKKAGAKKKAAAKKKTPAKKTTAKKKAAAKKTTAAKRTSAS